MLVAELIDAGIDLRAEGRLERGESSHGKTRAFLQGKDDYEVVFLGSSRVQRGIYPGTFDETLAELGRPLRSFNFGVGGVRFPEMLYWIAWILEQDPQSLGWLFIELQPIEHWIQPAHGWSSKRFTNWHSWAGTELAIRTVWAVQPDDVHRRIRGHAHRFLHRFFNVGAGVVTLAEFLFPRKAPLPPAGYDWRDELGRELNLGQGWRQFQAKPSPMTFGRLRRAAPPTVETDALQVEVLTELVSRLKARGIRPIFLIGPGGRPRDKLRSAFQAGHIPNLFAYELGLGWRLAEEEKRENPETEPTAADYFSDSLHLNEAGARIFGRLLAEEFHAFLEEEGTDR